MYTYNQLRIITNKVNKLLINSSWRKNLKLYNIAAKEIDKNFPEQYVYTKIIDMNMGTRNVIKEVFDRMVEGENKILNDY